MTAEPPKNFRALIVEQGEAGAFQRRIGTRRTDDLPPGDVLIRVAFSSVNYKDALSATGHPGVTQQFPHTPGIDAAGVVAESRDPNWRPGDEVIVTGFDLGMNTPGGLGGFVRVPAGWVVGKPDGMSLKHCMMLGTAGFTAALALDRMLHAGLPPQSEVVISGATGGVGQCAVALLAQLGYRVTAITGKADAHDMLTALGAAAVIGRDAFLALDARPMARAQWAGGIDNVGGPMLSAMLKSMARRGRVASCGLAASPELNTNVYPFILRGATLLGVDSAETPVETKARLWERLATEWKIGHLETIAHETDLEGVESVITDVLSGTHRGRTVVRLD